MTVVHVERIEEFWRRHPDSARALVAWLHATTGASWKTPIDVKRSMGSADIAVRVPSRRSVVVFDIRGNKYRLIAGIDYALGIVSVLNVLTHAEYDRNRGKDSL
jgi:mRNA interferase HigB